VPAGRDATLQVTLAILLPTSFSTFGDATSTEGAGPLRKYVRAQFRSDAQLTWVDRLRAALGSNEVKFKLFRERRPNLRRDAELWAQIESGVGQATLVVTDAEPLDRTIRRGLHADGAVEGIDYIEADVVSRAASALVAGTPLAWLPNELAKVVGFEVGSLERFAPDAIRKRIGTKLRSASIFAARAQRHVRCRDDR
jgi:hypothetical protein